MKKCMTWLMAALCSVAVAAPAMAADTIKIGVQGAHSGDLASYGVPSLNAAKIVIEEANAKGGVLGKKIELVSQDDQCKPELATNAATKLISDKVVAIMGPICSGATNASLPMYESANIISISPTATTPALTLEGKHPLFLRTVANDNAQAQLTSSYIIEVLKAKKVAYLHDNGEYGKGFAQQNRGILEKAGVETVLFEAVTPDAVDFSAVVRKLRRAKADVLIFGGYQNTASKLVQQMRRDRVKTPLIGPDGVKDETFLKMTGKAMRATAQNRKMALLLGINADRIISLTFIVGSALAALGGVLIASHMGQVNFGIGFLAGLKAFTAAVLGGIGSIPGAMVGGLVLGIAESMTTGYLSGNYEDALAFALLILILIFRPDGILGKAKVQKV